MSEDRMNVRQRTGWWNARGHIEAGGRSPMISIRLDAETMRAVRMQSMEEQVPAAEVLRRLILKGMRA